MVPFTNVFHIMCRLLVNKLTFSNTPNPRTTVIQICICLQKNIFRNDGKVVHKLHSLKTSTNDTCRSVNQPTDGRHKSKEPSAAL